MKARLQIRVIITDLDSEKEICSFITSAFNVRRAYYNFIWGNYKEYGFNPTNTWYKLANL